MARGGINKIAVQQARQALITRGENPSIDAIRIELGNTGSKSTIHRYLKELNGQQPVPSEGGVTLSDALSRLVGQLAAQLQIEADLKIEQAASTFIQQREHLQAQLQTAQQALAAAHQQHQIDVDALAAESAKLLCAQSALQAEQLRSASFNQEQRRKEGQLQTLQQGMLAKQDELTRLHRDNERLLAEHRQATRECKAQNELLEQRDAQIQGLRTILAQAQGAGDEMRRQLKERDEALVRLSLTPPLHQ
jgi:DNA repair exonuclease SbcCD ATPase subunit